MVVALGCNLPGAYTSRDALLEAALDAFAAEGLTVIARSTWWTSAAWPDPSAPAYLNGVAVVETALDPAATLEALHRLEAGFGRARSQVNAPRTLDLDLIAHGRTVTADQLQLPHPRAWERLFVMGPLAEIAPDWRDPVTGQTAARLAATATVGRDARPAADRSGL